jgi:hypothetical protein
VSTHHDANGARSRSCQLTVALPAAQPSLPPSGATVDSTDQRRTLPVEECTSATLTHGWPRSSTASSTPPSLLLTAEPPKILQLRALVRCVVRLLRKQAQTLPPVRFQKRQAPAADDSPSCAPLPDGRGADLIRLLRGLARAESLHQQGESESGRLSVTSYTTKSRHSQAAETLWPSPPSRLIHLRHDENPARPM